MRWPEGVVCMHRTCGAAAALKAKITELPRAEASARVAATKMLLCFCYIMYASCPITALDAFFFQKNVRRHTPTHKRHKRKAHVRNAQPYALQPAYFSSPLAQLE